MSTQPPGPAQPWGEVPYEQLLTGLRRFLRTDGRRYLDDPNVSSIGLGYKVTDGRPTAELAVQFTVEEKHAEPEALVALGTSPVPEAITVAGVRVPTDVLERRSSPAPAGRWPGEQVSLHGLRPPWRRGDDPGPDVVREA
jgi:endonuclease G